MEIHAIQTGRTQITRNWRIGHGAYLPRLARTLLDTQKTDWLPVLTWVIEHPEGLIVVDTGIPADANKPVYLPPFMPLVQRAASFQVEPGDEIGGQMMARGWSPDDVRWVVLTHLHQDHDGGLHWFPQAEFVVSAAEWAVAGGFGGRMGGYLNQRWPDWFAPKPITFEGAALPPFPGAHALTAAGDVLLVPTPGHSAGHLSVVCLQDERAVILAGDASYTQDLLWSDQPDGVAVDAGQEIESRRRIREFARQQPTIYLPSHDPDSITRLERGLTMGADILGRD